MNGTCPRCGQTRTVRGRRGDRVSNYQCPTCQVPLQGVTTGASKGRYHCPIYGCIVTLGLTGRRLDQPHRLVFQPGPDGFVPDPRHREEPTRHEQAHLDRIAGRVLGTGCVVSADFDPHRLDDAPATFRAEQLARAGLRLVPAADPGDPAGWILNEPLTYRTCVACGGRTPDLPRRRVPEEWTPGRQHVVHGRGRYGRRVEPVNQGPHPAGSLACPDCDPRRAVSESGS